MDLLRDQSNLDAERSKESMEEAKPENSEVKLPATTASSPCSSPSHDFSFTISFHSPSAAKSPSTLSSRGSAFDLAPADDIFFHGHLLPLQLLSRPPVTSSPLCSRGPPAGPPERDGAEQSRRDTHTHAINDSTTATTVTTNNNNNSSSSSSSSCSSSSGASSNGEAKERVKNRFLSALFMSKWRKASEAAEIREEEEEDEKKRKTRAFDAMSRLLRKYVSAVEPLFSFRSGRGRRGEPMRRRPYSFAGNPTPGAAVIGRAEEWRRRRGELSAPASMRTSPSNSGLLVAPAGDVGGSSDESTMEELRSAIEAAIAHCKSSVAMKEEKCKS